MTAHRYLLAYGITNGASELISSRPPDTLWPPEPPTGSSHWILRLHRYAQQYPPAATLAPGYSQRQDVATKHTSPTPVTPGYQGQAEFLLWLGGPDASGDLNKDVLLGTTVSQTRGERMCSCWKAWLTPSFPWTHSATFVRLLWFDLLT